MNNREDEKDILAKALAQLKGRTESSTPPAEVVQETLTKLGQAEWAGATEIDKGNRFRLRVWPMARLAVAAAVFITTGYTFGRAAAPKPPDVEQLWVALEPALRKSLVEEVARNQQQVLAAAYVQIKNDLTEQYRAELNRFAVQTFTASNNVTNQLLQELTQALRVSRFQDRQWVAAALEEMEVQHAQDSAKLGTAVVGLAVTTDTKLEQAKEDMVKLLVYQQPDIPAPVNDKINNPN